MRQLHRSKSAAAATLVGLVMAGTALAELVPGGGSQATDCYVELDVHGATGSPPSNHITCIDGDPNCDVDGQCQGTCTFSIAVCVNQTNVTGCTPKALQRPPTVSRSLRANLPIIQGTAPACGLPTNVTVSVVPRHGGVKLTGRKKLLTRASRDKDFLFLKCMPRKDACPLQTTTTTTHP